MGCSAHEPAGSPVSITQLGDEQLTCSEISTQMKANLGDTPDDSYRSHRTITEAVNGVFTGGPAGGVLGAVIAANTADQTDVNAVNAKSLSDRNQRLAFLARSKGCANP